jgi:hypothetical protein
MKKSTTVGCITVLAWALLATLTCVSANHVATGKGTYAVAPEFLFELHFVVATGGMNFFQSESTQTGGSISFQTTIIHSFTISPHPDGRMVTITGEMVSTTILGAGPERQPFAELVPFTAISLDKVTPGAGPDLFSVTVAYSATQAQGPLFASLGFGACQATTCVMTFEGPLQEGNIFVHTAGSD